MSHASVPLVGGQVGAEHVVVPFLTVTNQWLQGRNDGFDGYSSSYYNSYSGYNGYNCYKQVQQLQRVQQQQQSATTTVT